MRPIGVTLMAMLGWLRASSFALGGLGSDRSRTFKHPAGFSGRHRVDLKNGCSLCWEKPGNRCVTDRGGLCGSGFGLWLLKAWGTQPDFGFSWSLAVLRSDRSLGSHGTVSYRPGNRRSGRGDIPSLASGKKALRFCTSAREMREFGCSPYYRKRLCRVCR